MPDSDFARELQSLERCKRDGDWDSYLALAASPRFQEDLAAWTVRGGAAGATGPLDVLRFALGQAIRLERIGDAAALTLATARWSRRLSIRNAPGPPGPGTGQQGGPGYGSGEADVRTGRDVLRALLRAWELYDDGNPGAARSLLSAIVRGRPSLIRTSDGARWAVPLLRRALVIDPDAAARLLGLVDDNILGDLARELTAAGEYARARVAGAAMRLFFETKADILADLALAQAEAEDPRAVVATANLAADAAQRARREGSSATVAPRAPRVAGRLAKVAAALTLSGETALAAQRWTEAMAAGEEEPEPYRVLADLAQAQVRAGLVNDAAQIIEVLLGQAQPDVDDWEVNAALDPAWQAAAALTAAFADRGDLAHAAMVLRMIPDFAHSHPRAVAGLARAIAATDVAEAERLAGRVRDPDGRGYALAAVAASALSAGHQRDAIRVAGAIEHPRWRAQALVDLVGAPGQAASVPADDVRSAVAAVADAEHRAVLLAEYAVTQDTGERRGLLTQATRLAGKAPAEDRWRALTNIGATVAEAGLTADAREAFTAAQHVLARNPREWDFELYQLCLARLNAGDTAGARETAAVALGALPGRTAVAAADIPVAVAALASIAVSGQIERLLAEAERLATGLRGAGAIVADEAITRAYTALSDFTAAERRILSLLPPPDPGAEQDVSSRSSAADEDDDDYEEDDYEDDEDEQEDGEDEEDEEDSLVEVAKERGIALADALVAAGDSRHAATFMREVAGRLGPCAWGLGPGAPDMLAELAAAQVRTGDIEGARATAAFAATVAQGMAGAFRLPEPFGSPMEDWTGTVTAVVDAMTALMREAEIEPADFAGAGLRAIDYAHRPWQARARTLAALAGTRADPAERARLAAHLAGEQEQIWRLATATFVRGATIDLDDAAEALAVLAVAQAGIGEPAGARRAIARARELGADIQDLAERARALAEVVRGLSAIGDHAAAVTVARGIGHPGYEGQALAAAITAAARAGAGADPVGGVDLASEARAIEDTGWRAVALAAIAVASPGPPNLDEVNELIGEVPHGYPRTRAWREVIVQCVGAGRYDLAVDLAAEITADADTYLAVIAAELGVSAAEDSADVAAATTGDREEGRAALLRVLPRCARYPAAAYAACTALAMAFPQDAAAIAKAVAQTTVGYWLREEPRARSGESLCHSERKVAAAGSHEPAWEDDL